MERYEKPVLHCMGDAFSSIRDFSKTGSMMETDGSGRQRLAPAYDLDD
jgi:hypothetical protein